MFIGRSSWSVSPVEQSKEKEKSETEYESYPYGMENKAHDNFNTKRRKGISNLEVTVKSFMGCG